MLFVDAVAIDHAKIDMSPYEHCYLTTTKDHNEDDIIDLYEDCFDELYADHQIMIIIREIVEEKRILTSFIKNSSKAITIIQKLQINMIDKLLHVKFSVPKSTLLIND